MPPRKVIGCITYKIMLRMEVSTEYFSLCLLFSLRLLSLFIRCTHRTIKLLKETTVHAVDAIQLMNCCGYSIFIHSHNETDILRIEVSS